MSPEEIDRIETLDELNLLLTVVQELGAKLEKQTHGYLHHHARELGELLRHARSRLDMITVESRKMTAASDLPEIQPKQHRPRAF